MDASGELARVGRCGKAWRDPVTADRPPAGVQQDGVADPGGRVRRWVVAAVAAPLLLLAPVPLLVVAQSGLDQQECGVAALASKPAGMFTAEQVSIARAAAQLADQRGLPDRAKLVILATGFQESGL